MIDQFVIVDTNYSKGCSLYQGETVRVPWLAVPWIVNAFTNDLQYAKRYKSIEEAQRDCDRFTKEKFEFDGNTPLKPGRLKVMKLALVPVEQGG